MSDFAYPLHEVCGVVGSYGRAGPAAVAAAAFAAAAPGVVIDAAVFIKTTQKV